MSKQKRNDIQGLRAIAIFGVLLFHLAPKRFLNGFLGVDIFFVLSGYLMSSILSREKSINGEVVRGFYTRRFKRIVPLYSLMLVILSIITPLVFLPSDISHFVTDLEWALPFAENMQNVLKQFDYWDEVFNSPVLLHAWSLGVEIQYYLIVPFVMIVARFGETRRSRITAFLCFIAVSYLIHIFSSTTVSFGLLFARVWQFLTGSIFFELEDAVDVPKPAQYQAIDEAKLLVEDEEAGEEDQVICEVQDDGCFRYSSFVPPPCPISYCVTLYLIWMVIASTSGSTISRLLVTFVTGCLLLIGKFTQNTIVSNEIVVYIGDLSYLIYLAHWPVIILYKYYIDVSDLTVPDMSLCILSTLVISVLLHHSMERFFIVSSTFIAFLFVAFVYSIIFFGLVIGMPQRLSDHAHPLGGGGELSGSTVASTLNASLPSKGSFNRQEAITWNQVQSKVVYYRNPDGCVRDFEAERWTGVSGEGTMRCVSTGNGTAKVLVMGNSYGYRAFPVLHRLFAGRYAQMRMFTKSSRNMLIPDARNFAANEKMLVEKFQPDITFLIEKDMTTTLTKPIEGRVEDDPITKYMQTAIDLLSNHSGTVVVDTQYFKPNLTDGITYVIQKRLLQGKENFKDLRVSRKEYETLFANERARMSTIKNENVIVNKVEDQLCPGEQCYFFNRDNMHAYYGDKAAHLTTEGLLLLEPKYSEIIQDFLLRRASEVPNNS